MVSLAEQLKQLEDDVPKTVDPEEAYADVDGHDLTRSHAAREQYVDVGPSAMRRGEVAQTLLSDKYEGKPSSRMKIFDDDEEASEPEDEPMLDGGDDEDEEEDEEDEEEEDDEEDYDEDEDDDEDDEEDDEDEEEEEDEEPASGKALDPMGALRASRQKDIEKGGAIKRQRDLFDTLMTTRITFQKALTSAFALPVPLPSDAAGEVPSARDGVLASLGQLNETLLSLRASLVLPGSEPAPKRRKASASGAPTDEGYWRAAAADSFALVDSGHPALVPLLAKWSTKIQAATASLGSRSAGGSKLMQGSKPTGVVDAIDASLAQKRDRSKPLLEDAEQAYRALLREVIESKQGTTPTDLKHLRREKKRKREAERGGSKGRKIRYTVHDKAVNFVVPVPLEGWGEEQTDELFASLLGGAGIQGAKSEMPAQENVELGGLRMF